MNYNYQGVGGCGGIDWEFEIDVYNVNAVLKTDNQQRCNCFVVHLKLTQHC